MIGMIITTFCVLNYGQSFTEKIQESRPVTSGEFVVPRVFAASGIATK
jgi:hypothetical protein